MGQDGQEWKRDGNINIREIKEIKRLLDISVVTRPAYDGTTVDARDYNIPEFEEERAEEPEASLAEEQQEIKPDWRKYHLDLTKRKLLK